MSLRDAVDELYEQGHRTRRFPLFDPEGTYNVEAMRGLFTVRAILREPRLAPVLFRSVTDAGRRKEIRTPTVLEGPPRGARRWAG
jgi:hypothetical protein